MAVVYVSYFFRDPDWPEQVALFEVNSDGLAAGSLGRSMYEVLDGRNPSDEEAANGIARGPGGYQSRKDQIVHLSCYSLTEGEASAAEVIAQELTSCASAGESIVDKRDRLEGKNLAYLMIEMSADKSALYSDSFEGLP